MAHLSTQPPPVMLDESTTVRILIRERIRILSYIDSFLSDRQLAEDCFQDVCAAALSKDESFENETHVLRWALRVGRNKSIDLARKRVRQPALLDEDVLDAIESQWSEEQPPESELVAEKMSALGECLKSLTENSRQILQLRYVDGMKSRQIADSLGRKVESIYRALTRSHVALRDCMENKLQSHNPFAS